MGANLTPCPPVRAVGSSQLVAAVALWLQRDKEVGGPALLLPYEHPSSLFDAELAQLMQTADSRACLGELPPAQVDSEVINSEVIAVVLLGGL